MKVMETLWCKKWKYSRCYIKIWYISSIWPKTPYKIIYWTFCSLGDDSDYVIIDTTCSSGIIHNTVTFVHHTPRSSIGILHQYIKVTATSASDMMNENPKAAVAKLIDGSISDAEIMVPLLDCNMMVWINNFDHCMQHMQIPFETFEMIFDYYCWTG